MTTLQLQFRHLSKTAIHSLEPPSALRCLTAPLGNGRLANSIAIKPVQLWCCSPYIAAERFEHMHRKWEAGSVPHLLILKLGDHRLGWAKGTLSPPVEARPLHGQECKICRVTKSRRTSRTL